MNAQEKMVEVYFDAPMSDTAGIMDFLLSHMASISSQTGCMRAVQKRLCYRVNGVKCQYFPCSTCAADKPKQYSNEANNIVRDLFAALRGHPYGAGRADMSNNT
jgi:hypothetical protein